MSWGDDGAFAMAPQAFLVPNFLTDFSSRYVHILGADTNSYSRLDVKRGGKASSCGVRIDTIANIHKLKSNRFPSLRGIPLPSHLSHDLTQLGVAKKQRDAH